MGLTKRRDGYYVEMRVIDDGKMLRRATKEQGGKLKRWKVGCGNREAAHNYEAKLRADLNLGLVKSAQCSDLITFRVLCQRYLAQPEIQRQALHEWKQRMFNTRFLPRWADLPNRRRVAYDAGTVSRGTTHGWVSRRDTQPASGTPQACVQFCREGRLVREKPSTAGEVREGEQCERSNLDS